ncbi:hypothetical protein TeGR_g14096 [Tetraparma gracilis]|uniref:Dihydroprymidine dehydrogenase domain-containing protein n=1 Tax=Tetraparma gracilis TaxID=2962635 RepID=A0ABQ6MRY6_9STRA|nr:hypothetical protein TeGR_g14096 [Tetraparma gracilis]
MFALRRSLPPLRRLRPLSRGGSLPRPVRVLSSSPPGDASSPTIDFATGEHEVRHSDASGSARSVGSDRSHDNEPMVKRRDGTYASIDKLRGFLNYKRNPEPYRDPLERVTDWGELNPGAEADADLQHSQTERKVQAARCMDCGTPFCSTHSGCPVNNKIPEWNNLV